MREDTADLFLAELNAGLDRIRTEHGSLRVKTSTYLDAVWAAREIAMDARQREREDHAALVRPVLTLGGDGIEMRRSYIHEDDPAFILSPHESDVF